MHTYVHAVILLHPIYLLLLALIAGQVPEGFLPVLVSLCNCWKCLITCHLASFIADMLTFCHDGRSFLFAVS